MATAGDVVPFRSALRAWFLISLQTFGGPAGQIAVMQRTLVDERRWIGQRRFQHALNYAMLLPGPEAHQLAVYVGWLLNGFRGGVAAGVLFVLPGVAALLALSALYVGLGDTTVVSALFTGLGAAVVGIVAQAVTRIARRALTRPVLIGLAVAAFIALAVFGIPFPVLLAVAAIVGWITVRRVPDPVAEPADDGPQPLVPDEALHVEVPSGRRTLRRLAVGLVGWLAPVGVVALVTGAGSVLTTQGLFFAGTAVVTFGGAYAVLTFVAQQAVQTFGWLTAADMVRGLALAETTPGPLILVVQFVAFLGTFAAPGGLNPWVAGVVASLLVAWVTLVPSFGVHLPRGTVHRAPARQPFPGGCADRDHGRRRRRHREPGRLLRDVHSVRSHGHRRRRAARAGAARRHDPAPGAADDRGGGIVLLFAVRWQVLRVLGVCAVLGLAAGLTGLPVG